MAESVLKLAAIGTGGVWGTHAKNLAIIGGNQVVAICDTNQESRDKWTKSLGARGYESIDALFEAEKQLDGVFTCTPPTVRKQVVKAAAKLGVPVFIEKPPAFKLDDARQIVAQLKETPLPVMVGFMYRYLPAVDRVRELLKGRLINQVQGSFFCPGVTLWKLPGWFYIKEKSGGHILDQAIHAIDLIRYIAGDIKSVYTIGSNLIRAKHETFTIEDSSATAIQFANGATGTHLHSWGHSKSSGEFTFLGEDFKLTLTLDERVHGFIGEQTIDETCPAKPQDCSHHHAETLAFLRMLREGANAANDANILRTPYADAAKSFATVLAMNESIESGQPVVVPSVD